MKKGLSFLLVLCALMCTLLTGCGNSSVNLADYVTVTDNGYDGYGEISVKLDYEKLIKDYEDKLTDKNLDTDVFGDKTPELASAYVFEFLKPYEPSFEASENLKNNDKITLTWKINEDAVEKLKQVLDINIKCDNFSHTVKDLKALKEVDPFANIDYDYSGFSGNGEIKTATAIVKTENGQILEWSLDFDKSKNGTFANGNSVSFSLNDSYTDEACAKEYGIKLTRKSADIKLDVLRYFPTDNAREIFDCLTEEDKQNVIEAVKDKYKKYAGNIEVEYVGAVFYYTDPIDFTDKNYDENNRLALIFHVTNGIEPDGWYTYMSPVSPDTSVYIYPEKTEDGKLVKKTSFGSPMRQIHFPKASGNYSSDYKSGSKPNGPATYFTYNNLYYEGHQTIKECIESFTYYNVTNVTKLFSGQKVEMPYNHVVATDNLKQYIKEY